MAELPVGSSGGAATANAGAIYDLGYRNYEGARLGRLYAWKSLTLQSLKTAFGIGRTARAKVGPFALLAFAIIPALGAVLFAAAAGNAMQIMTHDQSFGQIAWIFALFCAGQAPELVGGDQQHRVLSLYFSRAIRRSDYVLAKLTALTVALLILGLTPQLLLFFGRAFVNENPWALITRDAHLLVPIFVSTILIALLFASMGLMISAITRRRLLATAAIIATLLLTLAAGSSLVRINPQGLKHTVLISPIQVADGLTMALFKKTPHPRSPMGRANLPGSTYIFTALGMTLAFAGLVHLRYRRIQT